jgi:hypothetical protein
MGSGGLSAGRGALARLSRQGLGHMGKSPTSSPGPRAAQAMPAKVKARAMGPPGYGAAVNGAGKEPSDGSLARPQGWPGHVWRARGMPALVRRPEPMTGKNRPWPSSLAAEAPLAGHPRRAWQGEGPPRAGKFPRPTGRRYRQGTRRKANSLASKPAGQPRGQAGPPIPGQQKVV